MIKQNSPGPGPRTVGISDIGIHIADRGLPVEELIAGRSLCDPELRKRLTKANGISGQKYVRFPRAWEDAVTFGAEAARQVLERTCPAQTPNIRLLAVGTETTVDHAKPVAAYIQGLLKTGGIDLGTSLSTL